MQKILKESPYYADVASKQGRLFLVRTKGSLSGGTPVTIVRRPNAFGDTNSVSHTLIVAGKVQVRIPTAPYLKDAIEEVFVTLDDLVIRRMGAHPDVLVGGNGEATKRAKNRKTRRKEEAVTQAVLEELKAKHNG